MSSNPVQAIERLVKSKQRVTDHGEVFTPAGTVQAMLDLVKGESERVDSRFLEPACGEGNFLREILLRKLTTVQNKYGNNEFERRHYALLGLMCIYGIELLEDNARSCRRNLAEIFCEFVNGPDSEIWSKAARTVLETNIIQADALTLKDPDGGHLVFPEWGYLGKGKFQRRDFKYGVLTQRSSFAGTLFDGLGDEDIFAPIKNYRPVTVFDLATKG